MNILFAASEMAPFCKTGGLADVVGALPPVLAAMGHDVSVILPGHGAIDRARYDFEFLRCKLHVPTGDDTVVVGLSVAEWRGVQVYLIENADLFFRAGLYGDAAGVDWPDNDLRFAVYSRAVMEAVRTLGLMPDIIHAHDWQAGLVCAHLKATFARDSWFRYTAAVFTIHNLGYQGLFSPASFALTGLPREEFFWTRLEHHKQVAYIKGGIAYADAVSTVSESYAREITTPAFGMGLEGTLDARGGDLHGIINGIDTDEWDPATDTVIPAVYSAADPAGKAACRVKLLDVCGFAASNAGLVVGMVTRLDDQKGLDILQAAAGRLMAMNIRLVILGTGAEKHHTALRALALRHRDHLYADLRFDNAMARLIYAGSDAFLMPSRYEPCGLGQLIALRYGTLPIVRATGGLADTVFDLDARPGDGNGFSFADYTPDALVDAVARAIKAFREPGRPRWDQARARAMEADYSWRASAARYVALYEAVGHRLRRAATR